MKKKHVAVHKDLEDQKQSITSMNSEQSRLENVIKVSSKIIQNLTPNGISISINLLYIMYQVNLVMLCLG